MTGLSAILKKLKRLQKVILSLLAISLLISCKTTVYVSDMCLVTKEIQVSKEDKEALRASTVSRVFIQGIADHNDLFRECP